MRLKEKIEEILIKYAEDIKNIMDIWIVNKDGETIFSYRGDLYIPFDYIERIIKKIKMLSSEDELDEVIIYMATKNLYIKEIDNIYFISLFKKQYNLGILRLMVEDLK